MQPSILNNNKVSNDQNIGHSQAIVENVTINVEIVGNKTIVTAPFSFKFKPKKYALTSNFASVVNKYAKDYGYNLVKYDEVLVKHNGIVYAVKLQVPVRVLAKGRLEEVYNSLTDGSTIFDTTTDEEFTEIANHRGHILEASLGGKNKKEKAHLIWASAVQQLIGDEAYNSNYIPLALLLARAVYNYTTTPREYAEHILNTGVQEFVAKWTPVTPTPPANRKGGK